MSSFNEIATDQMGNRMYLYGYDDRSVIPPAPTTFYSRLLDRYIFKDDVNGFSFISDICFLQYAQMKKVILPTACHVHSKVYFNE
jgi:hypothetical protein